MHKLSLETLSEERLKKSVNQETIDSALKLLDKDAVTVEEIKDLSAVCTVHDIRPYHVEIKIARKHIFLKCTCRHASRGLICEHEAAAWIELRKHLHEQIPPAWRSQLIHLINTTSNLTIQKSQEEFYIFFSLQENHLPFSKIWIIQPYYLLASAIPDDLDLDNLSNLDSLLRIHINSGKFPALRPQKLTKPANPSACLNNARESANIANLLLENNRLSPMDSNYPLHEYLSLLSNTDNVLYRGDHHTPLKQPLTIFSQPGEFQLRINKVKSGLLIKPILQSGSFTRDVNMVDIAVLTESPLWIQIDQNLVSIYPKQSLELLSAFDRPEGLFIEESQIDIFRNKYFLELSKNIPVHSELIEWKQIEEELIPRIYLDDKEGELRAQLRFRYGDFEVLHDPTLPEFSIQQKNGSWTLVKIKRNPQRELDIFTQLSSTSYGLKRSPSSTQAGMFSLRARVHPIDFLLNTVPQLSDVGYELFGEQELKTAKVNRNKPKISFAVSSGIDWFDVKTIVSFGDLEVNLRDIRKAIKKKQRFIKLADGTIGEIPEEWFERYKHLFTLGKTSEDYLRFTRHQITILDSVLEQEENKQLDKDYLSYRQKLKNLRNFKGIESKPIPDNFLGELRPYQIAGFNWLHFLHDFRFGGCLADDMGLGKTIQTLAFLISIYAGHPRKIPASLLIVPRSLLINWQREVENFTPALRVLEYFDIDRSKEIGSFEETDLIITTYGVLLRDIQILHSYTFYYAILDESQAIKNPNSQTARAAHLLNAKHRLVLTGTPLENSTTELWSQFSYLNPGLLGSQRYFKEEFASPIEKKGDEQVADNLRKIIYPFILRRTKDQVAPELPPRSEKIIYCDMEPEQRDYYNRIRDYYRGILLGMFETEGFEKSRIKILEGLLRLRQISNHPLLVDEQYQGASGKFGLLIERLTTLEAEGHKALVFSQFVQMLKLVRAELDTRKFPYTYLDGSTQNRQIQVDQFQDKDHIPFFLISLKAGGLGLNLTAADYVIHIDPWWNPAVEMQASDRTHRIGQDKPVFIFKLITRNTVEEKILLLQERKRHLVDQIITTESSFFKSLSPEEVENLFTY